MITILGLIIAFSINWVLGLVLLIIVISSLYSDEVDEH